MIEPLTHREAAIFMRIVEGQRYKEIANNLSIECNTVNSHVRNIYRKLGIHSKREARNLYIKSKEQS